MQGTFPMIAPKKLVWFVLVTRFPVGSPWFHQIWFQSGRASDKISGGFPWQDFRWVHYDSSLWLKPFSLSKDFRWVSLTRFPVGFPDKVSGGFTDKISGGFPDKISGGCVKTVRISTCTCEIQHMANPNECWEICDWFGPRVWLRSSTQSFTSSAAWSSAFLSSTLECPLSKQ